MADQTATGQGSTVNPADNLDQWLSDRDAKREPAKETAPAEPTVAEPAAVPQPAPSWKDTPIGEDVDHGFFRGKKVGDLYQSYRHVETAKQQAERERNELKQQLEAVQREREAEVAARKVLTERQVQPTEDPRYAKVNELWFADPMQAQALLREINDERAAKIAEEKLTSYRQENEKQQWEREMKTAAYRADEEARTRLGLDPDTWKKQKVAIYMELYDQNSPYYGDGYEAFRANSIISAHERIWGKPAPAAPQAPQIVVKPTPELPSPPGAKKPGKTSETETVSPISAEKRDAYERFAAMVGVEPDVMLKRLERRQGANRG